MDRTLKIAVLIAYVTSVCLGYLCISAGLLDTPAKFHRPELVIRGISGEPEMFDTVFALFLSLIWFGFGGTYLLGAAFGPLFLGIAQLINRGLIMLGFKDCKQNTEKEN